MVEKLWIQIYLNNYMSIILVALIKYWIMRRFWKTSTDFISNYLPKKQSDVNYASHKCSHFDLKGEIVSSKKNCFEHSTPYLAAYGLVNGSETNIQNDMRRMAHQDKNKNTIRCKNQKELIASCIMWNNSSNQRIPQLRQCLTYGEISKSRCDYTRQVFSIKGEEFKD